MTPGDGWLDALFEAHAPSVLAYALRRTTDDADAEDVTAETFVIAWRRREQVPDSAALPWLYAVARRLLANQRRGHDRRLRLLARLADQFPSTRSVPSQSEVVLAALGQLQPDDQELLRLVAWEELTRAEIARVLDITPNAVRIRLHRARMRLRHEMERAKGQ